MNYLVIFVLVVATASAFDLRKVKLEQRNLVVPTEDSKDRQDAVDGEIPYQVGLSLTITTTSSGWCSGSLISNTWVLTAAHCTDGILAANVYLGSSAYSKGEVSFLVIQNEMIVHPDWNRETFENDISLINIPRVTYSKNIQPVTLQDDSSPSKYFSEDVIASGWGGPTSESGPLTHDILQWASMEVVNIDICKKYYNISYESIVCVSAFDSDSGSPLVLKSHNLQIGLASYFLGPSCIGGFPVMFTRLTSFVKWIKDNTGISY